MLCTVLILTGHAALASVGASVGANTCMHALVFINMITTVTIVSVLPSSHGPPWMPNAVLHAGCKQQVLC